MPWHDLINIEESAEDRALRAELQELLGIAPHQPQCMDGDPDAATMTALAQSLHREAVRRGRISTSAAMTGAKPSFFKRPIFVNLAAAALVVATLSTLGTWGLDQKRRADALAAKTKELELRQNRMDEAKDAARGTEAPMLQAAEQPAQRPNKLEPRGKGELIKPEESPAQLNNTNEQYRVKDRR